MLSLPTKGSDLRAMFDDAMLAALVMKPETIPNLDKAIETTARMAETSGIFSATFILKCGGDLFLATVHPDGKFTIHWNFGRND